MCDLEIVFNVESTFLTLKSPLHFISYFFLLASHAIQTRAVGRCENPGGRVVIQGILEMKVLIPPKSGEGTIAPLSPDSDGPENDVFKCRQFTNEATMISQYFQ